MPKILILIPGEKIALSYMIKEEESPKSYNLKNFRVILISKSDGKKSRGDRNANTRLRKINAGKEIKPIKTSQEAMKRINKWEKTNCLWKIKNKKFVRCC